MKNSLKLGILLVGFSLLLWQCKTEDILEPQTNQKIKFKTVSFFEAQQLFNIYQKNTIDKLSSKKEGDVLQITPNWSTLKQDSLDFTEALLTNVEAKLNMPFEYQIRLVYLNINDTIIKAIESKDVQEVFGDGKLKNGKVYYHLFNGQFLDAYKIEEGIITKRLVKKEFQKINSAGKSATDCNEELDPNSTFCDNTLDEVTLNSSSSSSYTIYYFSITMLKLIEADPSGGGGDPTGGNGGGNNSTTNCPGIKIKDSNGKCVCPTGYTEDSGGKCVKPPCSGNPVANPEIASSGASGKKGGTFGCTRTDNTTCGGVYGKKNHSGLDIKANINESGFATYSGTISSVRNTFKPGEYKKDSYGNFVVITTLINGKTYNIKYNHLNSVSVSQGQTINVGDIIGKTGNTGNAADPDVIPHIHLQVFNSNWSQSLNPEDFLQTKFDSNYNPIPNNCQ